MTTAEEFLDTLDHVVADYETSDDAMRWMPEPVPEARRWPEFRVEWVRPVLPQNWDVWVSANPDLPGLRARLASTSTRWRGTTPTHVIHDEIRDFMIQSGEFAGPGPLDHSPGVTGTATSDPDKPGRTIALRHGVAAQHSPYGPKPRSRDGQMQGGHPRRARLPQGGRPRGRTARAHLGDEARP